MALVFSFLRSHDKQSDEQRFKQCLADNTTLEVTSEPPQPEMHPPKSLTVQGNSCGLACVPPLILPIEFLATPQLHVEVVVDRPVVVDIREVVDDVLHESQKSWMSEKRIKI